MSKNRSKLFVLFCIGLFICALGFFTPASAACTDNDGDGYGSPGDASCPKGKKTDCDNNDPKVYPGAAEICDGKDTNCDGWKPATDVDKDSDGVPMCKNDCNDNNNTVYPGAPELCDGIDNNCDYSIPVNERDLDADGYRTCGVPSDCNDNDRFINPGAQEWCSDTKDNNCNGQTDETPCICPDADNDGFTASYCGGTDCDDVNNTIYPGAPELCTDGKDNDCNGLKDCADPNAVNCPAITDADGDGFDVAGICGTPDCDDNDNKVYPGAAEICDGKDSNCDGWKAPSDTDADGDGVPLCASDCDDANPNRFPGNLEHALRNTCNDFIDNDCDNLTDAGDSDCIGSCQTGTSPKNGPHFFTLLNADNTIHPDNNTLSCGKCHAADFQDPVRYACQRCHADPADTSNPMNGTFKTQFPLNPPYGYGSAPNVISHTTWTLGDQGCVTCHNPHTQEQDDLFGTTYGKYIKEYICYDSKGIQQFVEFTSNIGPGSFADGAPYNANICNTCHTTTNHQQNDGTAPGGQDHNNGQNCMTCHAHAAGFAPVGGTPAAPHNTPEFTNNCDYCHVSATDYTSPIPDSKCGQCHTPVGALKASFPTAPNVLTHSAVNGSGTYIYNNDCVDCHRLMTASSNLKLVKTDLSAAGGGTNVVFTARTGAGSFADGAPYIENICNSCHTMTNHHQADGTAPGGQDHNNGADCAACHSHANAFLPSLTPPPAPHAAADCAACHITPDTYVFNAVIPNSACLSCHDSAAPGTLAGGSDTKVDTHFSTQYTDPTKGLLMDLDCVECHNPMRTQTNFRGNANLAFIRTTVRGNAIVFESNSGAYSFANDANMPADMTTANYICNTCHTQTNHHQNDGTAPGLQSHNDGSDCSQCHSHLSGFQPSGANVPPPHDGFNCTVCHVTPDTYVAGAAIPNSACLGCHDPAAPGSGAGGSNAKVAVHYSNNYIDPTTGQLANINCVECHNPMSIQTNFRGNINLSFVRTTIRGSAIAFETKTGNYSFAANPAGTPDMSAENYICNTCHTQTNHHQKDGTAPGGQSHNDGTDCSICHPHLDSFLPTGGACTDCHNQTQPNGAGDYRRVVVGGDIGSGSMKASHHVNGVVDPATCEVCHDQGSHMGNAEPGVLLNNPDGGAAIAYSGNAGQLTSFCLNCHDSNGAAAHNGTTPFSASGDNTTPPNVAAEWNLSFGHRVAGVACMECHGDSAGTGGPTDPFINGHGSDTARMLQYPYNSANQLAFCQSCHGDAGTTNWGTNVTLEFNTANASRHPIGTPLASGKRLTTGQLTGGWVPGSTMTCANCHDTTGGASGPHGSSVKWMLAGTNKAWPYTSVTNNGSTFGTFFYLGGSRTNMFCANCHPDTGSSNVNEVHNKGDHRSSSRGACVACHIRVPHGGKVSRLISAANNTANLPARLWPNGNGGGTVYLRKYTRASSPGNYSDSNCYSSNGSCGDHSSSSNGTESW